MKTIEYHTKSNKNMILNLFDSPIIRFKKIQVESEAHYVPKLMELEFSRSSIL